MILSSHALNGNIHPEHSDKATTSVATVVFSFNNQSNQSQKKSRYLFVHQDDFNRPEWKVVKRCK